MVYLILTSFPNLFFLYILSLLQIDHAVEEGSSDEEDDSNLVAGIFQTRKNKLRKAKNALYHSRDCSKVGIEKDAIDVALEEIKELIKDCFVTGKWAEGEDAEALLKEDAGKSFPCICMDERETITDWFQTVHSQDLIICYIKIIS